MTPQHCRRSWINRSKRDSWETRHDSIISREKARVKWTDSLDSQFFSSAESEKWLWYVKVIRGDLSLFNPSINQRYKKQNVNNISSYLVPNSFPSTDKASPIGPIHSWREKDICKRWKNKNDEIFCKLPFLDRKAISQNLTQSLNWSFNWQMISRWKCVVYTVTVPFAVGRFSYWIKSHNGKTGIQRLLLIRILSCFEDFISKAKAWISFRIWRYTDN